MRKTLILFLNRQKRRLVHEVAQISMWIMRVSRHVGLCHIEVDSQGRGFEGLIGAIMKAFFLSPLGFLQSECRMERSDQLCHNVLNCHDARKNQRTETAQPKKRTRRKTKIRSFNRQAFPQCLEVSLDLFFC